jgi:hypothetical protein
MVLDSGGEKGLLLGACFRSHVCVVLFSDLNVMPVLQQPSRNHLSKHMEHLPFTSAFWVLQVSRTVHSEAADWIKEVCCHNTGMSSHPSDHTCDSARSKHILYWCCDLIFVQRTQLGKEEGQKVER